MIWNAWQVLTVDTMYVGLLVIAVLGFIFSVVLDEIERRLIPWKSNA
jgi:ABC-type nitrate/sulfonate/bicarbonate transport system permease component